MEAIHYHNSMATESVKSLIAISDTLLPLCSQQTRVDSANFFGPWIADDKWSPRKSNTASPGAIKKQASSYPNVSKSLPRRLSLYTSANINNSPYGSYRNQSPAEERGPFKSKSRLGVRTNRSFLTTENIRRSKTRIRGVREKKTKKGEQDDELGEEEEEDEEGAINKNEQSQFSKPSLPALITLTSNTNDVRSTFALGKQLHLPLPRVYVSIDPKQSSRTNKSCSSALHAAMSNSSQICRHQNVIDNFIGNHVKSQNNTYDNNQRNGCLEKSYTFTGSFSKRDVSQCRSEALERALAARNPPPPTHNYDDISEHMRYYRLHHTVLGTGRFSLANEQDQSEAQPVQWQDLFPDRPLTAAKSITEVPVFRFSVADFRSQTAPSTKEVPTSLSPLPGAGVLKSLSPNDDQKNVEMSPTTYVDQNSKNNEEEYSDTSTATDEHEQIAFKENTSVSVSNTKCSSLQLEERYAKATRRSSFTVYNDSIQQVQSPNYRQGEDNEYMQYLRAKNVSDKRSIFKQNTFESISVKKSNPKSGVKSETQTSENTQIHDENVITPKVEGDRLSNNASKKVTKQPKIIKGSNITPRKCEGQYGPTTRAQQYRFGTPISSRKGYVSFEKHHQFSKLPEQRLFLDAERVRESIEEKIDLAERRLRSSINEAAIEHLAIDRRNKTLWRKIYKIERGFENTTGQTSNGLDDDATTVSKVGSLSQGLAQQSEDDETDAFFENLQSKRQEIFNKKIGKGEEIMQNDSLEKASVPGKKGISSQSRNNFSLVTSYDFRGYVESLRSKHPVREAELFQDVDKCKDESKESFSSRSEASMVYAKRNWRPRDSRVISAARESRNRGKHYKVQGDRPKSQLSTGDEESDRLRQNTSSATLRFKPTSPATSAFVIAAPSNSNAARGRSVVLPLEDFLEMAVDGRVKSFADWKTCLNNSSIGSISRSQVNDFQRSRGDGLLKVVSFATPVNQFIFAKKVTLDSTDGLGVFQSQSRKKKRAEEMNVVSRNVSSKRYRLRLSDFGLPEKFQRKTKNKHTSEKSKEEKVETTLNASKTETISKEEKEIEKTKELLAFCGDEFDETHHIVPTKSGCTESQHILVDALGPEDMPLTKSSSLSEDIPSVESHVTGRERKRNSKESTKRGRSVSTEAHACLRKEILRLVEAKKSDTAKSIAKGEFLDSKDGILKEHPKDNDVKELLSLQSLDETVRNDAYKQESRPVTTSLQDMKWSEDHRSGVRRKDSLSPQRLNLRHAARRSNGQDRSLSPARVHKYFQRRWSNTEPKKSDSELNLSPLAIKGGSLNIKSLSFESETKPTSCAVQDDVGETATESREWCGRSNITLSAQEYSVSLLETDYARDHDDVTLNHNYNRVKTSLTSEDERKTAKQNMSLEKSCMNSQSFQSIEIQENTKVVVNPTEDEDTPSAYIFDKQTNSHNDNSLNQTARNGSRKSKKYVRFFVDF